MKMFNPSYVVWLIGGGLAALALGLPDAALHAFALRLPPPLQDPITCAFLFLIPATFIVAAALFYVGLKAYPKSRSERATLTIVALGLGVLILIQAIARFYWLMVWDATYDPLTIFWLPLPILTALGCGIVLFTFLSGKPRFAGLVFLLLVPLLVMAANYAQSVDFRQLTQTRAEQVTQAIEQYQTRQGHYPKNLNELVPWYAVSLSNPTIIFGQDWCYQAGTDYYRLGYLDRDHWSSPILFGRLYSSGGAVPLKTDVCQAALDAYRVQHPEWDNVLAQYGRPTPTPGLESE